MPRRKSSSGYPSWKPRMETPEEKCSVLFSRIIRAQGAALAPYAKYQVNLDYMVGLGALVIDEEGNLDAAAGEGFYVTINRLLGNLASKRSGITYTRPWIKAKERLSGVETSEQERSATEYLLNYYLSRPNLDIDTEMRLGAISLMISYLIFKVWHKPIPEDRKQKRGIVTARIDPMTQELKIDVKGGRPKLEGPNDDLVNPKVLDTGEIETDLEDELPLEEHFGLEWMDWRNFFVDPDGGPQTKKHRYFCEREIIRLDDFMEDDEFKDFTNKEDVERAAARADDLIDQRRETAMRLATGGRRLWSPLILGPTMPFYQLNDQNAEKDDQRLILWTYYDLIEKRLEYIVEGHPKVVTPEDSDIPGWVGGHPFIFGRLHPTAGSWYPPTDVENYIPTAKLYDEASSLKITHMRRSIQKYWSPPDNMGDEQKEMFKTPYNGLLIESAIKPEPIADPDVNPSIYVDMNRFKLDGADTLGSIPDSTPENDPTATEVAAVSRKLGRRDAELAKVYRISFLGACNKILNGFQANLSTEIVVRITGPDGKFWTGRMTGEDVVTDLDLDLDIRELGPPDSGAKLRQMMEMTAVVGPVVMRSLKWVQRMLHELGDDDPALVADIVKQFQLAQSEALLAQQTQTLGPEPRQSRAPNGPGAGAGAGPNGGRQGARLERVQR